MSSGVVISGTGLWVPDYTLTNEELVDCYNQHVDRYNQQYSEEIDVGEVKAKAYSSAAFNQE